MNYAIVRKIIIGIVAVCLISLAMYGLHMHLNHNM